MTRRAWWEIAKREILDGTVTWKLPLAFGLTVLLVVAGVATLAGEYEAREEAYALAQDEYDAAEDPAAPEALAHRVLAKPNPLAVLVGGPAEDVRRAFTEPVQITETSVAPRVDPVSLRFAPADLATVAVLVLTLVAVLMAHDAIAGERERGTLKVLLVNPLTRRDVLLGKYAGLLLGLLAPVALAAILAVVVLEWRGLPLNASAYARLTLILAFLVLLVSAFVLVGLAASALTRRASVAVVAVLFAWLILVTGAGSVAAFTAEVDSAARTPGEVLQEAHAINAHYDELESEIERAIQDLEAREEAQNGTLTPEDRSRLEGLRRELAGLPRERAAAHDALLDAYLRGLETDLRRAEAAALSSPAEAYRTVAQTLARTDYESARHQMDEFSLYLREVRAARDAHEAAGRADEDFVPPAYRNAPESVRADLARAAPALAALVAHNVIAFGVAAAAFVRYDVR